MRWTMASLCVLMAACSSQNLNSPTSPTAPGGVPTASVGGGASQTQARGGTELPFHGSFTRETTGRFEPPITLVITGTEKGTASHLGRFTATSEDRVNTANVPVTSTGTFDFTAANGDELRTTTENVGIQDLSPTVAKVTLAATIVGGTGRFAGATGALTIIFTEVRGQGTATASGTIEGRLNLNRP